MAWFPPVRSSPCRDRRRRRGCSPKCRCAHKVSNASPGASAGRGPFRSCCVPTVASELDRPPDAAVVRSRPGELISLLVPLTPGALGLGLPLGSARIASISCHATAWFPSFLPLVSGHQPGQAQRAHDCQKLSKAITNGNRAPPRLARSLWWDRADGLEFDLRFVRKTGARLRVYPESYAALFLTYLNGIGFRASSGASRLIIPPMALILIQASLDSVRRS